MDSKSTDKLRLLLETAAQFKDSITGFTSVEVKLDWILTDTIMLPRVAIKLEK